MPKHSCEPQTQRLELELCFDPMLCIEQYIVCHEDGIENNNLRSS